MEGLVVFIVVAIVIIAILMSLHEAGLLIPIIVAISAISLGIFMYQQKQKELAEERERQAELKRDRDRKRAEEKSKEDGRKIEVSRKAQSINTIVDQANNQIVNIPKYLDAAEMAISQAVEKLKRRSFYPFWDCIAEAVENIQEYKNSIDQLNECRADYARNLVEYNSLSTSKDFHIIRSFPANQQSLPVLRMGSETASRIDQLYDVAHSDFEFSNIYANWRTNKTLVAGFQNLSSGLHSIREELEGINFTLVDGFDSVTSAVDNGTEQIVGSINELTTTVELQREDLSSYQASLVVRDDSGSAKSEKQDEMIRLLRNIQYKREDIPSVSDIGYHISTRPQQ